MCPLWHSYSMGSEPGVVVHPGAAPAIGTSNPWDPSQVWWYTQGRLRPRTPAPSPISGLLDSVLTPGSGGGVHAPSPISGLLDSVLTPGSGGGG
ncbi:unnamed protein product [Schistocephalus solidus]|uniref:Pre-S1 protein n=1 Tax=Schistocephalus solidus TaxID=70667 RepID=A0A183TMB8_SCHSO|nr:unnamed protein product [Schistocephalus solidus]